MPRTKESGTVSARVYTTLVNEAGATNSESDRMQFERFWDDRQSLSEYRFIGLLGFGGKFHVSRADGWRISCYPEDETPERSEIIDRTNAALAALREACPE